MTQKQEGVESRYVAENTAVGRVSATSMDQWSQGKRLVETLVARRDTREVEVAAYKDMIRTGTESSYAALLAIPKWHVTTV